MNPGDKLGPYEIGEPLGAGGMGEVYRARDPRLDRDVAIKVLPADVASDAERLARFEREAKLLAQLHHANIASIFGLETEGERRFIVMEVVEGETLADRIAAGGAFEAEEAIDMARQIAEALETAHESGVVHRDLKPANVKVTPEGKVKVLDFGLAKAAESAGTGASGDMSHSPTMAAATATGIILGTAAYMSPEQARGKPVDKRADIWAFGCVLYEMLTGRKAFDGETVSDAMAAILRAEPEWHRLPGTMPAPIERLVRRCLVKDPRRRLRDIGDARTELEEACENRALWEPEPASTAGTGDVGAVAGEGGAHGVHRVGARTGASRGWLPAAAVGVVAAALAFWLGATTSSVEDAGAGPVTRLTLSLPDGQRQDRIMTLPLAIAPDGSAVAYVARAEDGAPRLFIRRFDSFETIAVPDSYDAEVPFFSPDSRSVGFFSGGYIKRASVTGGPASNVVDASSLLGASWGRDGSIVFAPNLNGGLWRVSADGGEPERLSEPNFADAGYAHVWPQHLPDGRHLLFTTWGRGARGTYVLDLETRERRKLGNYPPGGAIYLPSGHVGLADSSGSGTFLAAPFDDAAVDLAGPAAPVLADVRFMDSASAHPFLAVSETGVAVYVRQSADDARLIWVDRQGAVTEAHRGEQAYAAVRVSPDGTRAAFHDEQGNLSLIDFERGGAVASLLHGTEFFSQTPVWHPSGERLAIASNDAGSWDIYEIDVAARGEPRPLVVGDRDQFPRHWSADGGLLAYIEDHPETGYDIWVLPRDGEPVAVLQSPANEIGPALSPDGRMLAFVSNETGRGVVSVVTYPEGVRSQVSEAGGESPVWGPDGRELFYRQGDWLMAATVSLEPELRVSAPVPVIEARWDRRGFQRYFDIAPNGERFLAVAERPTTEFVVIQNWFEELREALAAGQ